MEGDVAQHVLVAFAVAAILAPFSYYMGFVARFFKLPQITGYLVSGIVCGPYLLGILSKESVSDLNIIEGTCLSIIGLAAGAELDLAQLAKSRRQVLGITAGICVATWIICYTTLDWLEVAFKGLPQHDPSHLVATASLGATLMMTRSPASAIAVVRELDARGPFTSLVMAVVVVKDVFVIVAFALNIELIRTLILPASSKVGLSLINVLLPVISVALAMAVGACGGVALSMVLRQRWMPAAFGTGRSAAEAANKARMVVLVLLSTAVFVIAHRFDAEPLLACVTMGMVVTNRRHERPEDKEELHSMLQQIMSLSNVAFFGLAGASLKLSALKDLFLPAVVVCATRLAAIFIGAWVGCYATHTTPEVRRGFWMSMVTQAGVAMGLARLAGTRFPEWGGDFQTFMMSVILLNLAIGPPLFRSVLIRAGEAHAQGYARADVDARHHRDAADRKGGAGGIGMGGGVGGGVGGDGSIMGAGGSLVGGSVVGGVPIGGRVRGHSAAGDAEMGKLASVGSSVLAEGGDKRGGTAAAAAAAVAGGGTGGHPVVVAVRRDAAAEA
mmetsp:Transcript_30100/g.89277  ORF Transcript_30100/g.89277 Transcript_30100/m.89277 type:complete len:557 (-) Transcript_30100:608-2278(-)